jgi:hypothetical protein
VEHRNLRSEGVQGVREGGSWGRGGAAAAVLGVHGGEVLWKGVPAGGLEAPQEDLPPGAATAAAAAAAAAALDHKAAQCMEALHSIIQPLHSRWRRAACIAQVLIRAELEVRIDESSPPTIRSTIMTSSLSCW